MESPPPPAAPAAGAGAPAAATESAPSAPSPAGGPGPTYQLSFDDRATHLVDVQLTLPPADAGPRTLWMATWTPGSYLLREYARQVEGLVAHDDHGTALPVTRTSKNRWTVDAGGGAITVRYRVYAREASVRTNFVDADLAVLNGAALFITEEGREGAPHRVQIDLPDDWGGAHTGLDRTPGGGVTDFTAADLDELFDSPIVLGDAVVRPLDAPGAPHELVLAGELGPWDVDRSAADVAAIVREQRALWGDTPYDHYTFLNVVNEARGGLEHLDSTLMMTNRRATSTREAYVGWLGLVSHEFFHTWNVKRLRFAPLGPFDYEHEVYTPSLWVAEGLTSYYDDLTLVRAGLITEGEYLKRISDQLKGVQETPGRGVQTLSQASADAWIKYYRKDENTVNTGISYYSKGMLVGWLLDARIRCETDGARSLDDVMRAAYARHGGERGYTPDEFEAVIAEVAGTPLTAELDSWLRSTDELDFAPALACLGLRFVDPDARQTAAADAPAEPEDPPAGWLGAGFEARQARHVVTEVKRGTPAWHAGLNVGDELVAIDGFRVPTDGPDEIWKTLRPGATVRLTVSRRGRIRDLPATLGEKPKDRWKIEVDPDAPAPAAERRAAWLASAGAQTSR
jgi:predicted metalloprotease with PDZ domain